MSRKDTSSNEQAISFESEKRNTKNKSCEKLNYFNKIENKLQDLLCTKSSSNKQRLTFVTQEEIDEQNRREERIFELQRQMDEILGTEDKSSNKQTKLTLENKKCNSKHKKTERPHVDEQLVHELLTSDDSAASLESLAYSDAAESDNEVTCENSDVTNMKPTGDIKTTRQNMTFSNTKVRDIERHNSILMKRILSNNHRATHYNTVPVASKISSSAVNRKKQQMQIDRDNLILLRKIQSVKPTGLSRAKR